MTASRILNVGRQVSQDVWSGLRHVSHNTLALVGLTAVVATVFLAGRPDVRHDMELRMLGWLMERASERSADAEPVANDVLLAMADPEAIARATAADPAALTAQQANMVKWISRRYSVAPEPVSRLVQEAWAVGKKAGVEPTLILAIMAIESGFNPFAQSHVGAQGLMQVMTRVHRDKYELYGGHRAAFDPVTNLRVGVQVLKDCIARAGSLEGGLKHYVGAANLPSDGGYAAKVLAEQAYLNEVIAGRKVALNAPLPTAASVAAALAAAQGVLPVPPAVTPHAAAGVTAPAAAASAGAAVPAAPQVAPAVPPASASQPLPSRLPEQLAWAL